MDPVSKNILFFFIFIFILFCLNFPEEGIFLHPVTQVNLYITICEGKALF